jgi:hypothetical protein
MLRGDNIVCGTSTTGTGTLTLAATPAPPGGVDFDVLARATGIGFGNSAAVLVSYTIIEYTNSSFATAKQQEKGIGTLTLGGSSGIANCTLARTTVQQTATSLDAQPATYNVSAPSAITIGTAANVLVFIGVGAVDTIAFEPYVDATTGTGWAGPLQVRGSAAGGMSDIFSVTLLDTYFLFYWVTPMLVKRMAVQVATGTSGGTSNAYGRIYAVGSDGRPGKLLYDFGLLGTSNASLANGNTQITSGASGNGYLLLPGAYYLDLIASYSGGGVTPTMYGLVNSGVVPSALCADGGLAFAWGLPILDRATATGGTAGAAPDPANLTSFTPLLGSDGRFPAFAFKAS